MSSKDGRNRWKDNPGLWLPSQRSQLVQPVVEVHPLTDEESPESSVAQRTRARRPDVIPIAFNAELDLGKNYRNYAVYRQLHVNAMRIIDDLVASQNKTRYNV